jgi:hypothetical protein
MWCVWWDSRPTVGSSGEACPVRRFHGALSAEVAPSAWPPTYQLCRLPLATGVQIRINRRGENNAWISHVRVAVCEKIEGRGRGLGCVCLRVTRYVYERKLDTRVRSCFANRGLCLSTADSTGFECRIRTFSCSSLVGPSRQEARHSSVNSYGYCKFNQTPTKVPAQTPALVLRLPY